VFPLNANGETPVCGESKKISEADINLRKGKRLFKGQYALNDFR
jgi:hypothetical protein